MTRNTLGLATALAAVTLPAAATPTPEEMWDLIQKQQVEIEFLKGRLRSTDSDLQQTRVAVDATAQLVEESVLAGEPGNDPQTHIGGYAEMHYSNLNNDRAGGADKDELDFHRFVVTLGHQFNARTQFHSEVELEHSLVEGGEESGEIELEQAYVEHQLGAGHKLKAGLFLVPVGLINDTHEPNAFYGVERNNVESRIVPSTWWEGGLGLSGELVPGVRYDVALTSGLNLDADAGKFAVRDGRQKVARADASNPAYTARLKYTAVAGLELGLSLQYQQDLYQGQLDADVDAILLEAHLAFARGPFGLRVLYAGWEIDDAILSMAAGADRQQGWYLEPSWRLNSDWGVFGRYSLWDNQAGGSGDSEFSQWDLGFNFWLAEQVALKFGYQWQDVPSGMDELNGPSLGVGWSF